MTRRVVEKLCTKKVCVDFLAPKLVPDSSPESSRTSLSWFGFAGTTPEKRSK